MSLLHDNLIMIGTEQVQISVSLTHDDTRVRNVQKLGDVSPGLHLLYELQTRVIENLQASVLLAHVDFFTIKCDSEDVFSRLNFLITVNRAE